MITKEQRVAELREHVASGWDALKELCSTERPPHEKSWRGMVREKNACLRQIYEIVTAPETPEEHAAIAQMFSFTAAHTDPPAMFAELEAHRVIVESATAAA